MIDAGMPVDLADEKGQSLLMLASYNGRLETTRMLLIMEATVDLKNDRGQTPLGGVAFKGHAGIAQLLIEHGANVRANNGGGMTPMHYASMFGNFEIAKMIKKYGGDLERSKKGGIPEKERCRYWHGLWDGSVSFSGDKSFRSDPAVRDHFSVAPLLSLHPGDDPYLKP